MFTIFNSVKISDALKIGKPDSFYTKFKSLQTALYAGPFFAALSFAAYLFAAIYVDEDRKKVDDYIKSNITSLIYFIYKKKIKKIKF